MIKSIKGPDAESYKKDICKELFLTSPVGVDPDNLVVLIYCIIQEFWKLCVYNWILWFMLWRADRKCTCRWKTNLCWSLYGVDVIFLIIFQYRRIRWRGRGTRRSTWNWGSFRTLNWRYRKFGFAYRSWKFTRKLRRRRR